MLFLPILPILLMDLCASVLVGMGKEVSGLRYIHASFDWYYYYAPFQRSHIVLQRQQASRTV